MVVGGDIISSNHTVLMLYQAHCLINIDQALALYIAVHLFLQIEDLMGHVTIMRCVTIMGDCDKV